MVTTWQRKLGTVDVVLSTWVDVQRKWQALESIFVGSADIRVQLPEDSKRFDAVNVDFQVCSLPLTHVNACVELLVYRPFKECVPCRASLGC